MSILTDFFVFQNWPKETKSPDFIHRALWPHDFFWPRYIFLSCKFQRNYHDQHLHYRQSELDLILACTQNCSALATGAAIESLGAGAILA